MYLHHRIPHVFWPEAFTTATEFCHEYDGQRQDHGNLYFATHAAGDKQAMVSWIGLDFIDIEYEHCIKLYDAFISQCKDGDEFAGSTMYYGIGTASLRIMDDDALDKRESSYDADTPITCNPISDAIHVFWPEAFSPAMQFCRQYDGYTMEAQTYIHSTYGAVDKQAYLEYLTWKTITID